MYNRHMWWAHFLILPNIFVDACYCCCCCCYFENEPESSWDILHRVTLTKIISNAAEQDTVLMSLLFDFVSLLLVNTKEKQQYLVSFYKLPHLSILKGRAQTSL